MHCPKCGTETPPGVKACPACGIAFAGDKVLCEECTGAYRPGDLAVVEGRLLCPVCRGQKERRESGAAGPGLVRMTAWPMRKAPPRTSRLAIAALVSAFLFPPAALAIGVLALIRIERRREELSGRGIAAAGILLGALVLAALAAAGFLFREELERVALPGGRDPYAHVEASIGAIAQAQALHKERKGSFGGADALVAEGLLDGRVLEDPDYKVDVFLTRGKFLVTAVPKGGLKLYFLLDEQGELRVEEGRPAVRPSSPLWKDRGR